MRFESGSPELNELLDLFIAEANEGLQTMEKAVLRLENAPDDPELLPTLFRAAHTLKGNSASLGFADLTGFTHGLEDVLDKLRSGELTPAPHITTLLLESVDALREMLAEAVGAQP